MRHHRYTAIGLIHLFVLSSSLWALPSGDMGNLPLPPAMALESINEADLREHVEFLASDELGGRYALSRSNRIAARYLASRLRRDGFRGGAADGSYFQKIEIEIAQPDPDRTFIEIEGEREQTRFRLGEAFQLLPGEGGIETRGEVVLVPYRLLSSQDATVQAAVEGKIAVVPIDEETFAHLTPLEMFRLIMVGWIRRKAAGVLLLVQGHTTAARLPEYLQRRSMMPGRPRLKEDEEQTSLAPVAWVYDPLINALFEGLEVAWGTLATETTVRSLGKRVRLHIATTGSTRVTQNVIGILDGSDPQCKDEYVMFSAHYDHLASTETRIFNGADDDASGTAALLEIAEAFSLGPRPRRSIIIMFHTAEELGLLGSKYFVRHPTVPLESIVVDLNVDMIGRSRPPGDTDPADRELSDAHTLYLIGSDRLSQELHQLSEQTNRDTVGMTLDYRYNRPDHPLRLYYRSDHWNYAKNGIPVIFYFTGLHRDYHRTTDDVEKLDFEKMTRIARLIFATGWRIANLDHRLRVDHH